MIFSYGGGFASGPVSFMKGVVDTEGNPIVFGTRYEYTYVNGKNIYRPLTQAENDWHDAKYGQKRWTVAAQEMLRLYPDATDAEVDWDTLI